MNRQYSDGRLAIECYLLIGYNSLNPDYRQLLNARFQRWGYSSVAEHSTADREVTGSTPVAP